MDVHKLLTEKRVTIFGAHDMDNPADVGMGLVLIIKHQDVNKHVDLRQLLTLATGWGPQDS